MSAELDVTEQTLTLTFDRPIASYNLDEGAFIAFDGGGDEWASQGGQTATPNDPTIVLAMDITGATGSNPETLNYDPDLGPVTDNLGGNLRSFTGVPISVV